MRVPPGTHMPARTKDDVDPPGGYYRSRGSCSGGLGASGLANKVNDNNLKMPAKARATQVRGPPVRTTTKYYVYLILGA